MASVYRLEPDAQIGFQVGDVPHVVTFDHKGLYRTDDETEQMFLDGLVTDDSHPLKLGNKDS